MLIIANKENELIELESKRRELMDKVQVLDKVKALVMLPKQTVITTKQVADYFEVPVKTIKTIVDRNSNELQKNGLVILKGKKLKDFKKSFDDLTLKTTKINKVNRVLFVFTKRTVLNIAMLLRDSKVAKQIREELLDFVKDREKELATQLSKKEILQLKILNGSETEQMLALKEFELHTKQEIIEQVKDDLDIAEKLTTGKGSYDIGLFVKALAIKGLGKNNFFKLLKEKDILMKNNIPKQNFVKYFEIEIERKDPDTNLITYSKINIKPNGIKYVFKKLKQWGYIISKSSDEILNELEGEK